MHRLLNVEAVFAATLRKCFSSLRDAKKKLRLALCSADSVAFPMLTHSTRNGLPDHTDPEGKFYLCIQMFCTVFISSFLLSNDACTAGCRL